MSSIKSQILSQVFNNAVLTRAELSGRLNVGASTVSMQVAQLIEAGLLAELNESELPSAGERGRRRVPLGVAIGAFYALGLDLGGEHLRGVLVGGDGRILERRNEQRSWENADQALKAIVRVTRQLVRQVPAGGKLVGACFADPGLVDQDRQISLVALNVPGWRNINVPALLKDELDGPVQVVSSTVTKTIAEQLRGLAVGVKDFIFIDMGVGVAAGIVSGGRLLRGGRGMAGELGHTCVNPAGRLCSCGAVGCLEAECSGWAIVKGVEDLLGQAPPTQSILTKTRPPTAKAVVEAALAHDTLAQRILAQAGRALGMALANLVNLLNPDLIVFGGGLSAAGDILLGPAWQTMLERTLAPAKENIRFAVTTLDADTGAWGGALIVLQEYLAKAEF